MQNLTRIKRINLTSVVGATALVVTLGTSASPALSGNDLCQTVMGKAVLTLFLRPTTR
jgi:hypothetical protein